MDEAHDLLNRTRRYVCSLPTCRWKLYVAGYETDEMARRRMIDHSYSHQPQEYLQEIHRLRELLRQEVPVQRERGNT